ncbi:MAG: DUF885 domain-containing protein [Phenylobacterium sp.]|uniref:DUF885 domain-containing protein n=1 Tax=Phenylobacterium sp. TaxID=1871053 RepID=UPI0025D4FDD4|nr:DUF885 family protein [Phenylobacterium sp.]MBA4012075.1 DUF885 domain-containing protein [Phenylobacterium sp.]
MHSRRQLLLSAGALAVLGGCASKAAAPASVTPQPAAPVPALDAAAQLDAFLEKIFARALDDSPQLVTGLGLDKDARAPAKFKLDDASLAEKARAKALNTAQLNELRAIDRSRLTGMAGVNYDSVLFNLETAEAANQRFDYGYLGAGQPYMISQLSGSYQSTPAWLDNQHRIESKEDADAYLSRLADLGRVIDDEVERARKDVGAGVIPPDFIVARALPQMQGMLVAPEASGLVTSVARRAKEKGIAGDYAGQAAKIYAEKIAPALERQIALFKDIQGKAWHDAGVWRQPDGEAYYEQALHGSTTTRLSADEIHNIGLEQAKALQARADELLKGQGLTKGGVGERIQALYKDKRYHYPNTDVGKEKLIADLMDLVAATSKRLPEYFGTLPKAPLKIQRVPKAIEAAAPGGYYNQPSLDGARPGIYWLNLRDTAEYPKWALPTITYHEGVPGHHLQLSLQQEADLPMIRRATFLSAYGEGWALYAEELAREMGVYEGDPRGEIGYIQAALFRAGRLVVDTGMHAKRWSREKAIETMTAISGTPTTASTTEIERYVVWPGQACSYMVGKLEWLRLREKAKAALGPNFDIRKFHDAGLLSGAMPLTVLEAVVDQYIAGARG